MKINRIVSFAVLLMVTVSAWAQQVGSDIVVDYNKPQKYVVGGVKVEGNNYFSPDQILQITGMQKGMEVTVPLRIFAVLKITLYR